MPCTYYTDYEMSRIKSEEVKELAKQVNTLTDMLCRLCYRVENSHNLYLPQDIEGWYADHKKLDESGKNV